MPLRLVCGGRDENFLPGVKNSALYFPPMMRIMISRARCDYRDFLQKLRVIPGGNLFRPIVLKYLCSVLKISFSSEIFPPIPTLCSLYLFFGFQHGTESRQHRQEDLN